MTTRTADAVIHRYGTGDGHEPVNQGITHGVTVYRGTFAVTRAGYLISPDAAVHAGDKVWGVIDSAGPGTANTGAGIAGDTNTDGAVTAEIQTGSFYFYSSTGADALSAGDLGSTVYVFDGVTVAKTQGDRPIAGTLMAIDTTQPGGYVVNVGNAPPGTGSP